MLHPAQAMIRGRLAAEALMVDTCTITRPTTTTTTNPDTGAVTRTTTTVYSGKCRMRLPSPVARPDVVGGAQEFLQHPVLSLPATTTGVQIDDLVTMTASLLPGLVGRVFHVRAQPGQTHETAARFEVMEAMG